MYKEPYERTNIYIYMYFIFNIYILYIIFFYIIYIYFYIIYLYYIQYVYLPFTISKLEPLLSVAMFLRKYGNLRV